MNSKNRTLNKVIILFSLFLISTFGIGCSKNDVSTITSKEVLSNEKARQAIALTIDKKNITDNLFKDGSKPIDQWMPYGLATDENSKDYRKYNEIIGLKKDENKAKKLWQEAKKELEFEEIELSILVYDSKLSVSIAQVIQNELQENLKGLTIKINKMPYEAKMQNEQDGNYDLSLISWMADYPDPLTFLDTFTKGSILANFVGYKDDEYDKLIKEGKNLKSDTEAYGKYILAEKRLLNSANIVPLFQLSVPYIERSTIKDVASYSYGYGFSYKWASTTNKTNNINLTSMQDITTLDLSKADNTGAFEVLNDVMEGLTRVDINGKVVPGIAKDWSVSEDGMTWIFNIREDAKWSNGDKVKASDFEYSIKRTLSPKTASQYAFILYDIEGAEEYNLEKNNDSQSVGIRALDEKTLEIKLNRKVRYFDELVSFPTFFPQNEKVVNEKGDEYGKTLDSIVYNGPFKLIDWRFEDQYTMQKNKDYWDSKNVKLQSVSTKIIKDITAAINLYETGDVDKVYLSGEAIKKYKQNVEFKQKWEASVDALLINGGNYPK